MPISTLMPPALHSRGNSAFFAGSVDISKID
jgi:hypothetical protein